METLIVFNDLHLADKPPIGRRDGYAEEGLAMLQEMVDLANTHQAQLATTGDLFHIKRPHAVSHWLVQRVLDILNGLDRTLWVVPGNHDMGTQGADLSRQPLGVLFQSGLASPLTGYQYLPGFHLIGRPYNIDRDADPTYYQITNEERLLMLKNSRNSPSTCTVMLAHGSIIPDGQERPFPHVKTSQLSAGVDVLASGHIHEDLGITDLGDGSVFVNLGSLGRVARTDANMHRQVKCLFINGRGVHSIRVAAALDPAYIFHAPAQVPPGLAASEIEQFVAGLTQGLQLEEVDVLSLVKSLGLKPEVERLVLRYLEEAGL